MTEEIRGKAISESAVKMANGEIHTTNSFMDSSYVGKNVVIRNDNGNTVITERIDS